MNQFEYANPATLKEALDLLGDRWGETEILAGGTDLSPLMKDYIVTPKRLVDIKGVKELSGVTFNNNVLRIGATATFDDLVRNPQVATKYRALAQAADGVASPQIRNRGTAAGDLCQRPRCWYFRLGYGLLGMKDGKSLVVDGDNRYHAIFPAGPAYFVNPSSLAPALIAMDAELTLQSKSGTRKVKVAEFFVAPKSDAEREYTLRPNEVVTEIRIPSLPASTSATYEVRQKMHLDWPLAAASVVLNLAGGTVRSARVVLGHVGPTPVRSQAAEAALVGKRITEQNAEAAGAAAVRAAKPLSRNGYKIQLARVAVKRAVLAAAKA